MVVSPNPDKLTFFHWPYNRTLFLMHIWETNASACSKFCGIISDADEQATDSKYHEALDFYNSEYIYKSYGEARLWHDQSDRTMSCVYFQVPAPVGSRIFATMGVIFP